MVFTFKYINVDQYVYQSTNDGNGEQQKMLQHIPNNDSCTNKSNSEEITVGDSVIQEVEVTRE